MLNIITCKKNIYMWNLIINKKIYMCKKKRFVIYTNINNNILNNIHIYIFIN